MCSLHRFAAKRDANEKAIVQTLEACGFTVERVSAPGFPDLVVGRGGAMWLIEVKRPRGTLTPAQRAFQVRWRGPAPVILRTIEAAIAFSSHVRAVAA